jgi:hypothetical protein
MVAVSRLSKYVVAFVLVLVLARFACAFQPAHARAVSAPPLAKRASPVVQQQPRRSAPAHRRTSM